MDFVQPQFYYIQHNNGVIGEIAILSNLDKETAGIFYTFYTRNEFGALSQIKLSDNQLREFAGQFAYNLTVRECEFAPTPQAIKNRFKGSYSDSEKLEQYIFEALKNGQ